MSKGNVKRKPSPPPPQKPQKKMTLRDYEQKLVLERGGKFDDDDGDDDNSDGDRQQAEIVDDEDVRARRHENEEDAEPSYFERTRELKAAYASLFFATFIWHLNSNLIFNLYFIISLCGNEQIIYFPKLKTIYQSRIFKFFFALISSSLIFIYFSFKAAVEQDDADDEPLLRPRVKSVQQSVFLKI